MDLHSLDLEHLAAPAVAVDLEPEPAQILQSEEIGALPVHIQGPVRTQPLPRKAAAGVTYPLDAADTVGTQVLRSDPYRASAIILPIGGNVYIAFNAGDIGSPRAFTWKDGIPFPLTARTDVWVQAVTGSSTVVTVTQEAWARGE